MHTALEEQGAVAAVDADSAAGPAAAFAVVMANGQRVGIDAGHVVQAVAVPQDLAPVPRRSGGIVGVMTHAGQLVPVVRLAAWLAPAGAADAAGPDAHSGDIPGAGVSPTADTPSSADARVVILRDGDRVLGLLVDAVIGLQRCAPGGITRLFHDDRPDELFVRAARGAVDEPPLALLEPLRLAALSRVWAASVDALNIDATPQARATRPAVDAVATRRTQVGVFRIGDRHVGLDVMHIGELLRVPSLRPPPFHHPDARGLCDWRGRLLPVTDLACAIGALPDAAAPAWLCVVRHEARVLGVLVHEILALHAFDEPVAEFARADPPLIRRELPLADGLLQVLDAAALMARCPEAAISERRGETGTEGVRQTSAHRYLVFSSAGDYAARIDAIHQVVPLPDDLRPRLEAGLPVSLSWRGCVVPVRPLFAQASAALAPGQARQLIVVVAGGRMAAIPIAGVQAMISPHTATLSRVRVRGRALDVVSTGATAGERASYEVVDLEERTHAA